MGTQDDMLAQARALLTDIRGATKDLRAAKREIELVLKTGAVELVAMTVETEVKKAVEALGRVTAAEMAKSVAKVTSEFDRLENILLGKENDGQPTIEELIRRRRKW